MCIGVSDKDMHLYIKDAMFGRNFVQFKCPRNCWYKYNASHGQLIVLGTYFAGNSTDSQCTTIQMNLLLRDLYIYRRWSKYTLQTLTPMTLKLPSIPGCLSKSCLQQVYYSVLSAYAQSFVLPFAHTVMECNRASNTWHILE